MRAFTPFLLWTTVVCVAFLLGLQIAHAGTAEAPELADPSGDCAVPYGNEYLDVAAAWIEAEDADSFDVHLKLAKWQEALAEGSGYTVQFSHQGLSWGIVAVYSTVVSEGWEFSTGVATAELAEGFEEAPGSFDAASATIVVTFPKSIFPHTDATDTTLKGFTAMSADLRPAYPFFATEQDGNGRWIVCDQAVGTGEYAFGSGEHSAHAAMGPSAEPGADEATAAAAEPATNDTTLTPQSNERDTPLPIAVAVGALALAALRRR